MDDWLNISVLATEAKDGKKGQYLRVKIEVENGDTYDAIVGSNSAYLHNTLQELEASGETRKVRLMSSDDDKGVTYFIVAIEGVKKGDASTHSATGSRNHNAAEPATAPKAAPPPAAPAPAPAPARPATPAAATPKGNLPAPGSEARIITAQCDPDRRAMNWSACAELVASGMVAANQWRNLLANGEDYINGRGSKDLPGVHFVTGATPEAARDGTTRAS